MPFVKSKASKKIGLKSKSCLTSNQRQDKDLKQSEKEDKRLIDRKRFAT